MKLKNTIYKNIASILASDDMTFKTAKNIVLFSRLISIYPSKSIFCLISHRIISYIERNIINVSLMIDIMKDEGEDDEIISNIEMLNRSPSIQTRAEVERLCEVLSDYVKFYKILHAEDSFITSLDLIRDDDDTNIKGRTDALYKAATAVVNAYESVNTSSTLHSFDTDEVDGMKTVVATTKDSRDSNRVILTSIRGLNSILSPGYLGGCLYLYCALPGNYKSGILLTSHVDTCRYNQHIVKSLNGKTPISMYISMENSMTQTIRRLWALLYPTADMSMFTVDEATDMIKKALSENGFRSVILYYGYREKSTADLANIIRSYNNDKYEVVAVFLDYIKRIRPARTDTAATSSEKAELHAIMNELKNITVEFDIPIVSGHQFNREMAKAVDNIVANGGYNKTNEVLGRSGVSVAWEVMEVADWLASMNIENNGESKMLMINAAKQRDLDSSQDNSFTGIRHPFLTSQSFALKPDICETVSLSTPIYYGKQHTNYVANI